MDRKINAAAFKARCLALIDEVAETGQPITVTKRGKAKVQIVAVREKPKTLIGRDSRARSRSWATLRGPFSTRAIGTGSGNGERSVGNSMTLLLDTRR